ncbi:MAG: hypothetical protein U5K99_02085 [Anaerolineales bacterium]|nr:hypothetical protein [Anaerolineales bacterium]
METILLDQIPFQPDEQEAASALRIKKGSTQVQQLQQMLEEAAAIARPKALAKLAQIEGRSEDKIILNGITFKSRVLQVNTAEINRVFAFVATCGQELEEWKNSFQDPISNYYADQINQLALGAARQALVDELNRRFNLGDSSKMNPGSLEDWPLSEQRQLFKLLGDPETAIGVQLMPSMLMSPGQSVSGLRFSSEEDFTSCQLCPIENCPHRKAPFNPELYQEKYSA